MLKNMDVAHIESLMDEENSWFSWSIQDGKHWITNRHFAFFVDEKEAEEHETGWELLGLLEDKFEKKTPQKDRCLILNYGFVKESEQKIVDSIKKHFADKPTNSGVITPYIYAVDNFRHRWAKFKDFNLFIQDQYISVLYNAVNEPIFASNPTSPALLCNGQFLILPIRNMEKRVDFKELYDFEEMFESLELA